MTPRKAPNDMAERVYTFIKDYATVHGEAPTLDEIGRGIPMCKSGVHRIVSQLIEAGRLERTDRHSRNLRPVK